MLVYEEDILDMKKENKFKKISIPAEGLVLEPGKLYLGRTVEYTKTNCFVPMLEGRSSVGRLGLYIHVTAGFGDVGFEGYWTLEIQCVEPIRIYPNVEICQIYYHTIFGEYDLYNSGKYQKNNDVQPSLLYKDFEKEKKCSECINCELIEYANIDNVLFCNQGQFATKEYIAKNCRCYEEQEE